MRSGNVLGDEVWCADSILLVVVRSGLCAKFFHFILVIPWIYGARFVHRSTVMLEWV